jgi:hypothetical protein
MSVDNATTGVDSIDQGDGDDALILLRVDRRFS